MRPAARAAARGFSLLELVVVIVIMGVLAGVAAPAFWRAARVPEPAATAHEVVSLLARARRGAAERGGAVTLTIDPAAARWWVSAPAVGPVPPLDSSGALALPTGVRLSAERPRVTFQFNPAGDAWGATPLVVTADGRAVAVRVDRWTGEPVAHAP